MNDAAVTAKRLRRQAVMGGWERAPTSEANLDACRPGHVNAVDEADLMRAVLHDERARAGAVAKEPHAAHERAVGDAGRGEDDLLAGSEVPGAINLPEVGEAHDAAALPVLPPVPDQATKHLAVQP